MKKFLLLFTLGVILCMVSCEKANEPSITEKTVTDGCRVCIRYISGNDYIEYVGVDGRNHKDYYAGVYLVKKETTIIIYNDYNERIHRINVGNAEKLYISGDDGEVEAYLDMSF